MTANNSPIVTGIGTTYSSVYAPLQNGTSSRQHNKTLQRRVRNGKHTYTVYPMALDVMQNKTFRPTCKLAENPVKSIDKESRHTQTGGAQYTHLCLK